MATEAKMARFKQQLAKLEASKRNPDKVKMPPRERIRIRMRCRLCGRPRAVYRKFGICRICFRNMASDGLIPGVMKARAGEDVPTMMTDPMADMLTRIRNANRVERPAVDMPTTRLKAAVAQVLKDEGFILGYQVGKMGKDDQGHATFQEDGTAVGANAVLRVYLKYGPDGERVIRHIERSSKPGCRIYCRHTDLRPVLEGLGIAIISTSKGVMSDRQARSKRLGGELICKVW